MACNGCSTVSGLPKGCNNNGACGAGSCDKLSVFDWLANMNQPVEELRFPYLEVRFKNDRKEFFINSESIPLSMGDVIAVESTSGHDIGVVSLAGELVRTQMKHKKVKVEGEFPKIYRVANQKDIDVWQESRKKEQATMMQARTIAKNLNLDMKISDVEYQGDGTKVTFYYTSESRVDFRQLIREYAAAFRCRIEMRQIGYRQEASKLGGIGSCGRELCCSTWLTDFRSVSTAAARYQQLSINPQKIAGQCGKLKCCLNYELDSYMDAIKDFPRSETVIDTKVGKAMSVKVDVFKQDIWLAYQNSDNYTWYRFTKDQVKGFIETNKKGQAIRPLEDLYNEENQTDNLFSKDIIEENSLERFENKNKRRPQRRNQPKNQRTDSNANTPGTENNSNPSKRNNQNQRYKSKRKGDKN